MIAMEQLTPVSPTCDSTTEWCTIEHWMNLVSLYIGSVMYALLISNLSSIVLTVEMGQHLFSGKVKQVNEYMRSKRLPADLRDKVRDFFRLRFAEGEMFNEGEILKEVGDSHHFPVCAPPVSTFDRAVIVARVQISPTLQQEIMRFNATQLFFKVPLFGNSLESFKYTLATCIRPGVHFEDEVIPSHILVVST